jgi:hypothetical protein
MLSNNNIHCLCLGCCNENFLMNRRESNIAKKKIRQIIIIIFATVFFTTVFYYFDEMASVCFDVTKVGNDVIWNLCKFLNNIKL